MSKKMQSIDFPFSDSLAGVIVGKEGDDFLLETRSGRVFKVGLSEICSAQFLRNLGESYKNCTDSITSLLVENRSLFVFGIFYPLRKGLEFKAHQLIFFGEGVKEYLFEDPNWWRNQVEMLAHYYLEAQFKGKGIDYQKFRTLVDMHGKKLTSSLRQETNNFSRLVYGFATAYMMTGKESFLEGAEKGIAYLQDHMRFVDQDEEIVYWYHGIDIASGGKKEFKIFASQYGEDFEAIAAVEQIYALAGLAQTYRINGSKEILKDIELTVDLFDRFFYDPKFKGYFTHLDPITLDPRSSTLGENQSKKNWNSIGDHCPVYLFNLYIATQKPRYLKMLEQICDLIVQYFVSDKTPFVYERFLENWELDLTYDWQKEAAVIGHNFKCAWTLLRLAYYLPNKGYQAVAKKFVDNMIQCGGDGVRGGWFDVLERKEHPGEDFHRFVFHDRKAWWQQEQAILAFLLLSDHLRSKKYSQLTRETIAFYNAYFLDHCDGGIYFNTQANGIPYLVGTERYKGSRWMSGCHAFELGFLAEAYFQLLFTKNPLDFFFSPYPDGFIDRKLYVAPDFLPKERVRLTEVWVDGKSYSKFDPVEMFVELPDSAHRLNVQVRLEGCDGV